MKQDYELLNAEQRSNLGPRYYYTSQLTCVENISSLLKSPGQWEMYAVPLAGGSSTQYSLFTLIQYYVKPHIHLCPFLT
jgi:hypothetical protein